MDNLLVNCRRKDLLLTMVRDLAQKDDAYNQRILLFCKALVFTLMPKEFSQYLQSASDSTYLVKIKESN